MGFKYLRLSLKGFPVFETEIAGSWFILFRSCFLLMIIPVISANNMATPYNKTTVFHEIIILHLSLSNKLIYGVLICYTAFLISNHLKQQLPIQENLLQRNTKTQEMLPILQM